MVDPETLKQIFLKAQEQNNIEKVVIYFKDGNLLDSERPIGANISDDDKRRYEKVKVL